MGELYGLWEWLPDICATKSALGGDVDDRRWGDVEWMAAAQTSYLQLLVAVAWTGFRLNGSPPMFRPVRTPRTPADVEREKEAAEADRVYAARVASLRRFAPPSAEPSL